MTTTTRSSNQTPTAGSPIVRSSQKSCSLGSKILAVREQTTRSRNRTKMRMHQGTTSSKRASKKKTRLRKSWKKARTRSLSTKKARMRLKSFKKVTRTRWMKEKAQREASRNSMTGTAAITRSSQSRGFLSSEGTHRCLGSQCKDSIRADSSTGRADITTGTNKSRIRGQKNETLRRKPIPTMGGQGRSSGRVKVKMKSRASRTARTRMAGLRAKSQLSNGGAACSSSRDKDPSCSRSAFRKRCICR